MAVKKKDGVLLPRSAYMRPALQIADYFRDVVTSGREGRRGDGVHGSRSLHYDGLALDIRPFLEDIDGQMTDYLDAGYSVLFEGDHLHVSFDPSGQRM